MRDVLLEDRLSAVSRRSLFVGKAVFGALEVLLTIVLELSCIPLLGIVHDYTEVFPKAQFVYLFVCTLAVDLMLFFGEFLLMLWFGNPLPALCVGIVGALVGLFSAFMPQFVSYLVPWDYYIPLGAYEVANWDQGHPHRHLWHPVLRPDAGRHECQQNHRHPHGPLSDVFPQLSVLVRRIVRADRIPAEEPGRPGVMF